MFIIFLRRYESLLDSYLIQGSAEYTILPSWRQRKLRDAPEHSPLSRSRQGDHPGAQGVLRQLQLRVLPHGIGQHPGDQREQRGPGQPQGQPRAPTQAPPQGSRGPVQGWFTIHYLNLIYLEYLSICILVILFISFEGPSKREISCRPTQM